MFARNTPRRPHPFGWIDLNGRRWSVKGHQDINAYASFFPLRFFRCCFAQNLRSDDPRRSAEVDNAFWEEQLPGANVQFMHLDVTRIASHYIASADVLHLDQCFFSESAHAHENAHETHAASRNGSVFATTDRLSYSLLHTLSLAQRYSRSCVRSASHTRAAATKYMSPRRNRDAALCDVYQVIRPCAHRIHRHRALEA